ncbi:hypothetical protein [Methylobacterium radiotolerans]|uniref:hypothetical protein n=1 Tax=Methylobacterium radiotolerans TaxID=31998 RepID=UPI0038D0DEEA
MHPGLVSHKPRKVGPEPVRQPVEGRHDVVERGGHGLEEVTRRSGCLRELAPIAVTEMQRPGKGAREIGPPSLEGNAPRKQAHDLGKRLVLGIDHDLDGGPIDGRVTWASTHAEIVRRYA